MSTLYLLDTNILLHYVRDSRVWRSIQARYTLLLRDPSPIISAVSVGELISLARRNRWGPRRMSQARFICAHLRSVEIGTGRLYEAYATVEAETNRLGRPMGQNDQWIAASAIVSGATILTTDRDFNHLRPSLLQVEWFDPSLLTGGTP